MLDDKKTYAKLKGDPTSKEKNRLIKILRELKKKGRFDDQTYRQIYPTSKVAARFYATPKVHKKDVPVRPIVSGINSITYGLAKHMAKLLNPLVGKV